MERLTVIDINKEYLKFSAAHFTIFDATDRERLHGHNFLVCARACSPVGDNGLCFPYDLLKKKLKSLCDELDEYTLLPGESPHMTVQPEGDYYQALYNGEKLVFVKPDTIVLPVRNTTVEELSHYLLERILGDDSFVADHDIRALEVKVSSGPGQCGNAVWGSF